VTRRGDGGDDIAPEVGVDEQTVHEYDRRALPGVVIPNAAAGQIYLVSAAE
jgi:hypothetical protein